MKVGEGSRQDTPPASGPGRAVPPQGKTLEEELNEVRDRYKATAAAPGAPVAPTLISGYLLLVVVDAVIPEVIVFLLRRFGKRTDVKATQLRLSEDALKKLEPLADAAAAKLLVGMDPVTLLAVSMSAMYIVNIPPRPEAK